MPPKLSAKPSAVDKKQSEVSKKSAIKPALVTETYIIVPPDGGWGWVILFIAFCSNFLADGTMYTFGLFMKDIGDSINESPEKVADINSLMTGFYYTTGPFIAALVNRYGFRIIAFIGALMSSSAIFATTFLTTYNSIALVYGVIGGTGFGMMYIPAVIAVGYYFERWRALANCISATGSAIGITCFPLIFGVLFYSADWKWKFQLIAASLLFCAFMLLLYRPLEPVRVVTVDEKAVHFKGSFTSMLSLVPVEREPSFIVQSDSKYYNANFPTSAEVHGKTVGIEGPVSNLPSRPVSRHSISRPSSSMSKPSPSRPNHPLKTLHEDEEEVIKKPCCTSCCRCFKLCICCCFIRSKPVTTRPLYRDDIFYGGSVTLLPQYHHGDLESNDIDYNLSVTRVVAVEEIQQTNRCIMCPHSIIRPIVTMLDLKLLTSLSFFLLCLSGFFSMLGLYTPFVFIPERAIANGIDPKVAYGLITAIGISNAIGRMTSGIIMSILPHLNALLVSSVSLIISGSILLVSSMSYAVQFQYVCSIIFSATICCVASIRPIIVCDMIGLENLTNGFGLCILFQGLACLAGLPFSTFLIKISNGYDLAFYFSGSSILLSGLLLIPLKSIMKWEKRRNRG